MNAANKDRLELYVECNCSGFVFQFRDRKYLPAQRLWTLPQTWPRRRCLTPPTPVPNLVLTPLNERPRKCTWSPKLFWKVDVSIGAGILLSTADSLICLYAILCYSFLNEWQLFTHSAEPHTKDIDVFLKRDIETGFGFRVLGGEGPQQPVSLSHSCCKIPCASDI